MTTALANKGKPRGLLRLLVRAPIALYRLRLGWLLGKRFLMVIHTGRTSGKIRRTVLEVIHRDRDRGTYSVASGWGEGADWLRNLQTTPDAAIMVGLRRWDVRADRHTVADGARILCDYARRNPRAFRALSRFMMGQTLSADDTGAETLAEHVPVVTFTPR